MSLLPRVLELRRREIDAELAALLNRDLPPDRLGAAMRYAVLGAGKRVRGSLLLTAFRACGGRPAAHALPAACALEVIHAYSLVHDDLPAMDDADLRRGRPSVHKVYGEALAILVGDALFGYAFDLLTRGSAPAARRLEAVGRVARATGPAGLAGGQAVDIAADKELDPRTLRHLHCAKTARFIAVALEVGAVLAGAPRAKVDALARAGICLGMLFQVTDDILDESAPAARTGKRRGRDAGLGRLTYPRLYGPDRARAIAARYQARALAALTRFGRSGADLRTIVRFVGTRSF